MVCHHCGGVVTEEAPAGLCPGCLIRTAAASGTRDAIPDLPRLRYFGDYELLEEIARGGMGVVYKARQMSLDRIVALKMMRPGLLATPEEVARFRAEAASAARLQHPNIVTIFEVGEQDGLHYFSMDYVAGANLAELVREGRLPEQQSIQYVKTVAEAVEFAHTHGTLHRDLKPSNILIDLGGRPRITDFGLALPLHAGEAADTAIAGTPAYMSPEQTAGETLTAAADVFALGAILHELLYGGHINRDLETICAKAMMREPRRRYESARELAEDLGRYLRREPIAARRIGVAARAWRWVRRNPWQTSAAAALAFAALLAYRSAITFREQYFTGLLEQARLERITGNLAEAGKLVRKAAAIHTNLATRQEAADWAAAPGVELLLDIPFGWPDEVRFTADGARVAVHGHGYAGDNTRGDVIRVWDIATGRLIAGSTEWPAVPCRATVSPDGHISAELVVQGSHGELAISDAATGQRITTLADNHTPAWSGTGLLATLGGNRIATPHGSMGMERTVAPGVTMGGSRVRVWRVKNVAPSYSVGEIVREISVSDRGVTANRGEQRPPAGLLATSPVCRRGVWAVGTPGKPDRAVELRDAQTGERVAMLDAINRVWPDGRAAFSPDGALLVVQEPHTVNDLKIFDPGSGKLLRTVPMNSMRQRAFAFLSARRTVSVGSGVRIVDLDTGRIVARWDAGTMEAQDRAVATSGSVIATAGEDRKIHLWTLDGHEITRWTAHVADVTALAFDPAGKVLYSGAEDGSLRVWDLGRMRAESARLGVSW